jgi:catechol 2,3-dioxygenase-like lactoylglutathione lyase family enzyme
MPQGMSVCQVAFSVLDLDATMSWYRDVFGFVATGGQTDQGGAEAAAMQGLPACRCDMAWLVDRQDFFQLEFFRYADPEPRPRRPDALVSDIGYAVVGLHVQDFDAVLGRLSAFGTTPVAPVVGAAPNRRVGVRDPEGVHVEIMEDDVRASGGALPAVTRPAIPVATRFVRLVVDDLAAARGFLVDVLRLRPADVTLHGPEHSALWGEDTTTDTVLLWAGDFLVELVHHVTPPSRPRPEGYRISDQGLLNVALGSRAVRDYRTLVSGIPEGTDEIVVHHEMEMGSAVVRYLTGPGGISVEVLAIPDPEIERAAGFRPAGRD